LEVAAWAAGGAALATLYLLPTLRAQARACRTYVSRHEDTAHYPLQNMRCVGGLGALFFSFFLNSDNGCENTSQTSINDTVLSYPANGVRYVSSSRSANWLSSWSLRTDPALSREQSRVSHPPQIRRTCEQRRTSAAHKSSVPPSTPSKYLTSCLSSHFGCKIHAWRRIAPLHDRTSNSLHRHL
jgi:hypothetical protein